MENAQSTAIADKYRLGNQIVLVRGKHASALYDLYHQRIQRISSLLGEILSAEDTDSVLAPDDITAADELKQRLAKRGFLEITGRNLPVNYSCDWRFPRFPVVRTISFAFDESVATHYERRRRLVIDAAEKYGLCSFAYLTALESLPLAISEADKLLRQTSEQICEFWLTDHFELSTDFDKLKSRHEGRVILAVLPNARCVAAGITQYGERDIWPWSAPIGPEALVCRADFFHLLRERSESSGCLHIDLDRFVYPDVSERSFQIGKLDDYRDLAQLLEDTRLTHYWTTGKDAREKCRDCEYRYACPNPLSKRSNMADLRSAPSNCLYDMERGIWPET